eukprot:TRINITY_DN19382_c0_g1_i1.p1 TRINITY_DN19382_c0_g1~~TRINITY_DN19382_c0_g1_i1.p1  ORF type:complete len:494 (+),score=46.31 TRINITY_DN19382_c0_g1_i1:133-1482(+)
MAVTAMQWMPRPVVDSRTGREYLKTSQTTRHYLGFHFSNLISTMQMNISERDLFDSYLPAYEALQVNRTSWTGDAGGRAEGIMCSYSSFNGVPSCANSRLLKDILRGEFGSTALVQSDCCDSISSIWNKHHYTESLEGAVAAATQAGTDLCFACGAQHEQAFADALKTGTLNMSDLDRAIERVFLTRMRLGEFDIEHPYSDVDEMLMNSSTHHALARESAAASIVLVKNDNSALPLKTASGAYRNIAVIGPFADCGDCYLHSYNGKPSYIVSPLAAIQEVAVSLGVGVLFSNGSHIAGAAAIAARADVTILVLGLGNQAEHECLDRVSLNFSSSQEELLRMIRKQTMPTRSSIVLVSVSAGPVFFDETLVDAALIAGYGGMEAGHGLVDVLFGYVSPSARLPVTYYAADYLLKVPPEQNYSMTLGAGRTYRYLNESSSYPFFRFGSRPQ